MPLALVSLPELLQQYDIALAWLSAHGVRVKATRLAAYRKIIARAEHNEALGRDDHQQRAELLNAIIEASEIIEITELEEQHLQAGDVLHKLKQICSGPETMAPERADPARDYAFEFHTAAVLQRQGKFGGFSNRNGDLTVTEERYPAECKRVSSLDSLRTRLRKGKDKLGQLMLDGGLPGVIAIDITRPIRIAHGPIKAESVEQFAQIAEQRLVAYLPEHVMTERNIDSLSDPSVLGVMVRCLSAGIVDNVTNIRRSVVWQACSLHAENSQEDALFHRVARAFGPGELRQGTGDEIAIAVGKIAVVPNRRP